MTESMKLFAAFAGANLVNRGSLSEVVADCKSRLNAGESERIALFDDETGRVVDVDFSGTDADVLARLPTFDSDEAVARSEEPKQPERPEQPVRRRPGRPKLGVVCREVSLLPRHWSWLAEQRGGASATLRRLVEAAKKDGADDSRRRNAIDAAHRFMWDIAGNQPDFEEATRSLFAADWERLLALISTWPHGLREQLERYVARARA
jgi:uncharacterized protein